MSRSAPLISVIIPVYNTGQSAAKLIKKLLQDKCQDLEIIIVDDGSTDNSLQLMQRVSQSQRLKIYHQTNKGRSAARNLGLQKAKGEYIVFLDSDDNISSKLITKLVQVVQQPDVALATTAQKYVKLQPPQTEILYTNPTIMPKSHESRMAYVMRVLLKDGRVYGVIGKIFHASVIKQHHLQFDQSMRFAEDTKFMLEYLKYTSGDIITIPQPLYIYYYGTTTSQSKSDTADWSQWQKSYRNLKRWVGKNPTLQERLLLKKIYLRWRGSWAKANLRSHK